NRGAKMNRSTRWIRMGLEGVRRGIKTTVESITNRSDWKPVWTGTPLKDHLTPDDWAKFNKELGRQLENKDDKGVAITCGSMVDDRLRWVLETRFIPTADRNWLFKVPGPLQAFAAKIELAYALGLIREDTRIELNIIRKIRNEFAHGFKDTSF